MKILLPLLFFAATVHADTGAIRVNEFSMPRSEFFERVDDEFRNARRLPPNADLSRLSDTDKALRRRIAEELSTHAVNRMLLMSAAAKAGIAVAPAEIDGKLGEIAAPYGSVAGFESAVIRNGGTMANIRAQIQKEILIEKFAAQMVSDIAATEAEARKYYLEKPEEFVQAENVRARHILITGDTALGEIQKIKREIEKGASFEDMARRSSACPSAEQGGDLGYFARGVMVGPFEQAAFTLPVGVVSDPVKTQLGYHLVCVEDHPPAKPAAFEEVRDRLIEGLTRLKRQAALRDLLRDLRAKATIEVSL